MKTIKFLGIFIILITIINLPGKSQVSVGELALDYSFFDTDGESFTLSDQKGKVVFMFLFGNTCPSCLSVGGKTQSDIYDVFKDDPDFVAVGLDQWNNSSSVASVSTFKSQTGITYPMLIKAGSISTAYGTTYDRLLVVDKEGILRHKGTSGASGDINNAVSVIQEYLMTASIEDGVQSASVGFYPNPVSEYAQLKISLLQRGMADLSIYNAIGQVRLERSYHLNAGENDLDLDLSNLENGIHFYKVRTPNNQLLTGKFLVNKN